MFNRYAEQAEIIRMIKPIKFSIVITCHNQQSYISSCICSIQKQTYNFFECIIVDDGSIDNSVRIINEQIKNDSRFMLVTQTWGGVSAARNAGLSCISGDFVTFLDGDDELDEDCLEKCSHYIDDKDLLIFGISNVYYNGETELYRVTSFPYVTRFESGRELADWYVNNHAILLYSCGNKMYRTSVIRENGLKFDSEIRWGEDRLFNYCFLEFCKEIRTIRDCSQVHRHIDEQSLTSVFRLHHIDTLLMLHNLKMQYLLPLATSVSDREKEEFRRYDIYKEVRNAFLHIAEHMEELTNELLADEYLYLNNVHLPKYFYGFSSESDADYSTHNLTDWITEKVYGLDRDFEDIKPDVVIILGSRSCGYRVDAALKQFGHLDDVTYICSGGNYSEYTDCDGEELIEAEYMYKRLLKSGIPNDRIITEKESHNTYENIKNSIDYYEGLSTSNYSPKYTVVTAGFHRMRVKQLLESVDYNAGVFCADGPNTHRGDWYKKSIGINIIFDELTKLLGI